MQNKANLLLLTIENNRRMRLAEEIDLIKRDFPQIVSGAEKFVLETHALPWETVAMFQEGELGAIQEKYNVHATKSRPVTDGTEPETDLFCEACELVYTRWGLEVNPDSHLGYRTYF